VQGRTEQRPVHELLLISGGQGLTRLPAPSPGDIFFDLEGDPFASLDGREYLFGYLTNNGEYVGRWALNPADERAAFETFIDTAMGAWREHGDMHVYHFTGYEPGALKRLMGRYATREDEIDRMLRAGIFVDLHSITRQSVRASVEQYSLKQLEAFHRFPRIIPLEQARSAMRLVEHTLELSRQTEIDDVTRQTIEGYNRDDCASTKSLRDWLEAQRDTLIAAGEDVPRPPLGDGAPSEALDEQQARIAALVAALTATSRQTKPCGRRNRQDDGYLPTFSTTTAAKAKPTGGSIFASGTYPTTTSMTRRTELPDYPTRDETSSRAANYQRIRTRIQTKRPRCARVTNSITVSRRSAR
jgi:uncharacterized protein